MRTLALLVLCTAAVRLYDLDFACLWIDEMRSLADSQSLQLASTKVFHPPLYFWCLYLWRGLFGDSDFAMRSLTVLFACGNTCLIYAIAKDIYGNKRVAVLAGLIYAFLPHSVYMDREVRMYTQLTTFYLVALFGCIGLILGNLQRFRIWAYVAGTALALATHYYAAIYVAPMALALLIVSLQRESVLTVKKTMTIHAPFLIGGLTVLAVILYRYGGFPVQWITGRSLATGGEILKPFASIFDVFNFRAVFPTMKVSWVVGIGSLIFVLITVGALFARRLSYALIAISLVPFFFINLAEIRNHNFRYWTPSFAIFAIMMAGSLIGLWSGKSFNRQQLAPVWTRVLLRGFVATIALVFVYNLPGTLAKVYSHPKEPWREVVKLIRMNESPSDVIYTSPKRLRLSIARYYEGNLRMFRALGTPGANSVEVSDLDQRRSWVVLGYPSEKDYLHLKKIAENRDLLLVKKFPRIQVFLYSGVRTSPQDEVDAAAVGGSAPRF